MMSTKIFQPRIHSSLQCSLLFSNPNHTSRSFRTPVTQKKAGALSLPSCTSHQLKVNSNRSYQCSFTCAAAAEALESVDSETPSAPQVTSRSSAAQESNVMMVKPITKVIAKPRLVLKFIWMEKCIGLGLNQEILGYGTIPLSPYYFWPRKDAWEELKSCIESKSWISQKSMIILLNQATDIINLWQQSGGNISS